MGKKSREKWERRLALATAKSDKSPTASMLTWVFTLAATGAGMALSDGPWEVSGALFIIAMPLAWISIFHLFSGLKSRTLRMALLVVSEVAVSCSLVWLANRVMRIRIELSDSEGSEFTRMLKEIPNKPELVKFSCAQGNEDSCVFGQKFIPLFQRAGWKVEGPIIERVLLGRPSSDILLANYGPPLIDPQNPDVGVWTEVLSWQYPEEKVFQKFGIKVHTISDSNLPKTMTRVYFGWVPQITLKEKMILLRDSWRSSLAGPL